MKILVLGKGQLGQELLGLNSQTTSVVAFNSVECDICDKTTVELTIKKIDPNIVVNTAAYTNVDEAEDNIKEAFSVNAQGPENISKVCEKFRIPLIHISTDYVFDGRKGEAYVESDEVNPLCVYGKSKLQGEQNVQTFCSNFCLFFGQKVSLNDNKNEKKRPK